MPDMQSLIGGSSGLYRVGSEVSVAALRRATIQAGRALLTVEGEEATGKAGFLRACAEGLRFPPYVGRNWDALEEALRDLGWLAAPDLRGYVLLIDPIAPLIRHAPADWAVARSILASAADHWRPTPTPLTVLLRRADGLARDLPPLLV